MLFNETNINYEFNDNTKINNIRENNLYTQEEGFNKGSIFKNIYVNYKDYIYEINTTNEKDNLLYTIQKYTFALKDLSLYLDIYPNDKEMLNEYNNNLKLLKECENKYEIKYGLLTSYGINNNLYWNWSKNPWPWDKGEKYV